MIKNIFLVFLLVLSLFAGENFDDFVPDIEYFSGDIDSAVLAPDGKSFYTLKDGLVTHWKLNPIERVDSFITDAKQVKRDWQHMYNMHITDDASKLVINSPLSIQVWDLENRKLIVKKEVKTSYGVMLNSNFYTISQDRSLIQWNLKNLEIKQQKKFSDLCIGREETSCKNEPYAMFGDGNILAISSRNFISLVNTETLNSIKDIYKAFARVISLSLDGKYLYYIAKPSPSNFAEERPPVVRLEISTGLINLVSPLYVHTAQMTSALMDSVSRYDSSMPQMYPTGLSIANNLVLARTVFKISRGRSTSNGYGFFNAKSKEVLGQFFQFEDGEWILMDIKGYFEASNNARKHLLMRQKKHLENEYPINDAIYNKYNKYIILKAD